MHRCIDSVIVTFDMPKRKQLPYMYANIFYADTTDVQNVQVVQVNGTNAFEVLCDYIPGSNANGCMVVLVGGTPNVNNITVNLTRARDGSASTKVVYLTLPTLCYDQVFAFDIEYDGSVAAIAVPGRLITSEEPSVSVVGCSRDGDQTRTPGLPSKSTPGDVGKPMEGSISE